MNELLKKYREQLESFETMKDGLESQMLYMTAKEFYHNIPVTDANAPINKGYSIWTEIEPLLEKYGNAENVPECK